MDLRQEQGIAQLLTAREAAEILRISVRVIWRMRSTGELPAVRIGGSTRFRSEDIGALIDAGAEKLRAKGGVGNPRVGTSVGGSANEEVDHGRSK